MGGETPGVRAGHSCMNAGYFDRDFVDQHARVSWREIVHEHARPLDRDLVQKEIPGPSTRIWCKKEIPGPGTGDSCSKENPALRLGFQG